MAEDLNLDGLNDGLISRAESIKDSFLDLRNATREANQQLARMGEGMASFASTYSTITRSASKVADIQKQAAKSSAAVGSALKEQEKNLSAVQALNVKIDDLYQRASRATGETRQALLGQAQNLASARDNAKDLADAYGEIADDAAKVNSKTAFFNGLSNVVGDIPGLRKLAGPFQDAAKAARETVISNAKTGKNVSVMGAGMKGFAKSAMSSATSFLKSGGYIGIIVMGLKKAWDIMMQADAASAKLAGSLNMSKQEAADLSREITASTTGMDYLTERIGAAQELMASFADSTGIVATNTEIFNKDLDAAQRRLGLSAEQTNHLAEKMLAAHHSAEDFITGVLGGAEALEMQIGANLQMQAIMKDVADLSAAQTMALGKNPALIGKAVAQVRALGLSFSMLETTMGGLLDFESSIGSELEAELLIGKELNLDRARAAALNNDYATVAAEVAKQVGSAAEFSKMNRVQQDALAKSVGMTRDSLAKVLKEQEAISAAGFESAAAREEEYQRLVKLYGQEEALKRIGDEQFAQQKRNISFQEKINMLVENLKKIFMTSIEPVVANILGTLEKNPEVINNIIDKVKGFATGASKALTNFETIGRVVKGLGQILHGALIAPLKSAYHLVMSVVKGLQSAYYYSTFQFSKAAEAGAEAADHVAQTVTNALDVGTGIIAGVATMSGAKNMNATGISDAYKSTGGLSGKLNVDDFTIQTNPKDTLVMAGGTRFGEETNALLRQLIQTIEKGSDVVLNGDKVGQALALGASKMR